MKEEEKKKDEKLWWTVGLILVIQGFGAGITDLVWRHPFGLPALAIHYGAPTWITWVVGALGVAAVAWAIYREGQPKKAAASR
ncbi:hypothetical protein [Nocardia sp. CDC160]|uniref:hypothetical protein n=1 Tax=Nocardia sp. CDC160 TaxID=3112166 RepID=UPI002DB621C4|nr:hypothetical protein [Nocardia sp. CDC160]MEC3915167.1 hypothetical protein [Nocardia sp. CDC160]